MNLAVYIFRSYIKLLVADPQTHNIFSLWARTPCDAWCKVNALKCSVNIKKSLQKGCESNVIKGPMDNFKPSLQRILLTHDAEIPHGTNAVILLAHKSDLI